MHLQQKKSFAAVDYDKCRPKTCSPSEGKCHSASACTHRVIKQIDGVFEEPMVFQDLCLACWDCIKACPFDAVYEKHIS